MSTDLTPVPEQDPWTLETLVDTIDHLAGKTTRMTPEQVLEAIRAALARELVGLHPRPLGFRVLIDGEWHLFNAADVEVIYPQQHRCTWGDDAWHRAVSRLIRLHRPAYRRLLAEERERT